MERDERGKQQQLIREDNKRLKEGVQVERRLPRVDLNLEYSPNSPTTKEKAPKAGILRVSLKLMYKKWSKS